MTEEHPSVKPEQIKQALSEKNQKSQHHTYYDYYKPETTVDEINEFIAYSEVKIDLPQYEAEYNDTYTLWEQCSLEQRKSIIQQATDYLDLLEEDKRLFSAKSLAYISLGKFFVLFLMLNLYKALSVTMGDNYVEMKSNIRAACNLPVINDKSTFVKCTPEDLYSFYHQSCERYPSFSPTAPPEKIKSPLTIAASTQLSKAMGLYKSSKNIDLPYQTLFPSKNQPANNTTVVKTKQLAMETTNVLPYTYNSPMIPKSLVEASSIWMDHLYISVANYQIIYEREKAIHRWQRQNEKIDDWKEIIYDKLNETGQRKMAQIELLYETIVPNFQNIVVVLLKLLLSTVSIGKDKEAEILEDINITRNREIISKSVSGVLLSMLKWFKISHVLKFEYLSQILIDSGCMLLILKLLGLQEVALLASKKTDDDRQSFFGYVRQMEIDYDEEEDEEEKPYTNTRNLLWPINLLRILQMLTKRKMHRILLLVQYKSSAILKRLLKVGHPVIDLYVLKNLKNQVPYMGKRWRSSNMKTISSIYAHCLTSLNDDWLSSPEGNGDMEEGAMREVNIRMLSRLYNGHRYLPNILPKMDDISGPDSTLFYFNNYPVEEKGRRLPEYNLNEPMLVDDVELDLDFKNNYQSWLGDNVYSTTDDEEEEEEEEEEDIDSDTGHIGTPLPDALPMPITADDLANEINKLYLEELQREFIETKQKENESLVQEDGWDKPTISTTAWGSVPLDGASSSTKANTFGEEEEADEVEPEVDPLQGINWCDLTEEDLKKRLTLVQEKTVQRWLNVEMDDPRYLKVLNTFEGEVLVDDEGWPI
ncbi:hypothetical protein INT48_005305 [Thamnidium elegans]|uniref:BEACH domain-containing protein n=1 Tax=Thamnidium elegans TaxID=101142 RepID=A0A8H7VV00_9FUNG|nr:hypothetical protein INT48_005305 [Thamnidium elegans]